MIDFVVFGEVFFVDCKPSVSLVAWYFFIYLVLVALSHVLVLFE